MSKNISTLAVLAMARTFAPIPMKEDKFLHADEAKIRTIEIHDQEELDVFYSYLVENWNPDELDDATERRWNEECVLHKAAFMETWSSMERAMFREENAMRRDMGLGSIDPELASDEVMDPKKMELAMRKRANVYNRTFFKERAMATCRALQLSEDLYLKGEISRSVHTARLNKVLMQCVALLKNNKERARRGHTWLTVAALKNNVLSLMENIGIEVKNWQWARNSYDNNKIVDFEFPQYNPDKTQDDWNKDILALFYEVNS